MTANFLNNRRRKFSRGFTLIEMVVAAALLTVAMTLVATIFVTSMVGQRKVISFEQASSNARYLMDTVSREIRTAIICGDTAGVRPCKDVNNNTPAVQPGLTSPDIRLDIMKTEGTISTPVTYCMWRTSPLNDTQVELRRLVNDSDFSLNPCQDIPPADTQTLNSPEIALIASSTIAFTSGFITEGVGQNSPGSGTCFLGAGSVFDGCQPRVTMIFWVQSVTQHESKERVSVQAQTTLSQRLLDVP